MKITLDIDSSQIFLKETKEAFEVKQGDIQICRPITRSIDYELIFKNEGVANITIHEDETFKEKTYPHVKIKASNDSLKELINKEIDGVVEK